MEFQAGNIQVAIVAVRFLTRLGIKTLLSVIGIEPEYIELTNIDQLKNLKRNSKSKSYLIIEQGVLYQPVVKHLEEIGKNMPGWKIMVIGDKIIDNCPCSHFVLNSDRRQEILEKFQDFFYEPENNSSILNSGQNILSEREIEVLKEVARGLANKEIADKLHISINTVITHRKNITEKLGVKTVSALTVYALINNFISPDEAIK